MVNFTTVLYCVRNTGIIGYTPNVPKLRLVQPTFFLLNTAPLPQILQFGPQIFAPQQSIFFVGRVFEPAYRRVGGQMIGEGFINSG